MSYNPKTDYSKLPRTKKDLQDRINDAYQRGSDDATRKWKEDMRIKKYHEEELHSKRNNTRLEVLRQIINLASAYGQLMQTITEAMKSETE